MERLGWATTGRKATVGSEHIGKAEVYARGEGNSMALAVAALDRVIGIGDENERARTAATLVDALAASRAAYGRSPSRSSRGGDEGPGALGRRLPCEPVVDRTCSAMSGAVRLSRLRASPTISNCRSTAERSSASDS